MKQLFSAIIILVLMLPWTPAFADTSAPEIRLDGETINFSDGAPFIDENGRVQIPIGVLARMLGAEASWDGITRTAYLEYGDTAIEIEIGRSVLLVNGVQKPMDTEARLENGWTYIPVRYVAEAFGMTVKWDEKDGSVNLGSIQKSVDKDLSFDFTLLSYMPNDENYMVSPLSLKMALAMTANGAQGDTQDEILKVLGISDLEEFNKITRKFIEQCSKSEHAQLSIANSIWHNKDYFNINDLGFSKDFTQLIKNDYSGVAEDINNANGASRINSWISQNTNGKIKDVLKDDDIKECLTFLVNTIYFTGDWSNPFRAESTDQGLFTQRDETQKETAFMHQQAYHDYYEDESFAVLAKPYEGNEITMYIVLAKDGSKITKAAFEKAAANMTSKNVRLKLPKFETEFLHDDLIRIMEDMGMKTAFDKDQADLLKMYSIDPPQNIFINKLLQKTFIRVDEKGTEAAAATVVGAGATSMPLEIIDFSCDRPFTYFILHEDTGEILFMGEYAYVR